MCSRKADWAEGVGRLVGWLGSNGIDVQVLMRLFEWTAFRRVCGAFGYDTKACVCDDRLRASCRRRDRKCMWKVSVLRGLTVLLIIAFHAALCLTGHLFSTKFSKQAI